MLSDFHARALTYKLMRGQESDYVTQSKFLKRCCDNRALLYCVCVCDLYSPGQQATLKALRQSVLLPQPGHLLRADSAQRDVLRVSWPKVIL